jgi:hypothetical protein
MKRRALLAGAALLAGCAAAPRPLAPTPLPALRLPPAALGAQRHALSQRLSVWRLDRPDDAPQRVDVQLQLDATGLLLAGFAFGQRVLLLQWDGQALQVQRHPHLPAEVDTDRMLRDLCLVLWPADAVRAALPAGWTWTGEELREGGQLRLRVLRLGAHAVEVLNPTEGYRLLIESQPLEGA